MPLPRRVVLAVTSAVAPLHKGHNTGVWINEAMHPFVAFRKAGFEVDIVSETGTYGEDWLSMQPDFLNGKDKEMYEDHSSEFRSQMDDLLTPDKIDPTKYGIFFASAGHAAMIDYPTAKGLQKIAIQVWAQGGLVTSVCHGPAIFPGVIDPATGKSVAYGKNFTGFGTHGEEVMGLSDTLRSWNVPWVEEVAEQLHATYKSDPDPWAAFHVVDGRLITGQNPASAQGTADAIIKVFETL